jgi:hypothetical protein
MESLSVQETCGTTTTQQPTCGAMVEELMIAGERGPRRRLDSSNMHAPDSKVITVGSSPVENDRQLMRLHTKESEKAGSTGEVRPGQRNRYQPMSDIVRSFTDLVGLTTQRVSDGLNVPAHLLPINMDSFQSRHMRVQLSLNDPTLPQVYRTAHRLYVTGCPLVDMRSHGCTMRHIVGIGVHYDNWTYQCGFGLREVALMGGSWHDAVDMGFSPAHMSERDRNGAALLRDGPFNLTWNDLEYDLGLTIDEAIFEVGLTSADLAMLGEDLNSLIRRGFGSQHAQHMNEPSCNFQSTLNACPEDIDYVFGSNFSDKKKTAVSRTRKSVITQADPLMRERTSKQKSFVF